MILNDCPSGELTCVDEKLVGDSRMIHVMDSSCKNGGQDFQICEDGLRSKMNTFYSMSHLPILRFCSMLKYPTSFLLGEGQCVDFYNVSYTNLIKCGFYPPSQGLMWKEWRPEPIPSLWAAAREDTGPVPMESDQLVPNAFFLAK